MASFKGFWQSILRKLSRLIRNLALPFNRKTLFNNSYLFVVNFAVAILKVSFRVFCINNFTSLEWNSCNTELEGISNRWASVKKQKIWFTWNRVFDKNYVHEINVSSFWKLWLAFEFIELENHMWCVARFGTIGTIWKTWETPMKD